MIKNHYNFDLAEMTDNQGNLRGFLAEDIDIYVPPKDMVLLDDASDVKKASLVFPVPTSWVEKNRRGHPKEIEALGWEKKVKKDRLLEDFASLAEAKPKRYLAFAKKWGPYWHQIAPFDIDVDKINSEVAPWVEHIWLLSILAKEVKAILEIAAYLRQGKLAKRDSWTILTGGELNEDNYQTIEQQRKFLADYINIKGEFVNFSQLQDNIPLSYFVRLRIDWSGDDPRLFIATKMGFFSAMWLQLLQAVTARHVHICSGCSRTYVRDRKPAEGRYNFCESCRGVTDKASKRLHAKKKRES